jgi:hypothetical protein
MSNFFSPMSRPVSRRCLLRGVGAALALPWLDAMRPAFAMVPKAKPVRRMLAIQTNMGILSQHFFPTEVGKAYKITPYLELLKQHRDQFTVFSGVSHPDVDGAHEAEKAFLSATPHPGSAAFKSTISLDQYAAERFGPVTRFSSFTLGVNQEAVQGMSFNRAGVKVPAERSPAALYRKMFLQGKPDEVLARMEELRQGRSLLDFVSENAKRLNRDLGPADQDRLDQYYTAVRELEKQLQQAQEWEKKPKPKATVPEPVDVPDQKKLLQRIQLMLDVTKLAFESDSTRVVSLFINTFSIVPEIPGVTQETHSLTHHGGRPEALDQLFRIESAQFKVLNDFLTSLQKTTDAGTPLLDKTMVLYGAPMGSANSHANTNLPILLAGGGFKHAGHLAFDVKKNYPLPNLFVSMLQQLGLESDKFASSTGTMRGLELS